ncbi:ABC transporter substrate-binding protein, partial [Roseomonas mucosa]
MFQRRHLLQLGAAALAAPALAAPRIAQATSQRVLKFVPQSDLTVLDPVWTTATVTRNHAFLVFDTLYGLDTDFRPHPQMAEGHVVEADGRAWNIRLRPGLMFHDGTPVLARDCVASLQRWGRRDAFGQSLMAVTEALEAQDDRTIRFRLKRPFPLLVHALAKSTATVPVIMPERLAKTDAFTQVPEI